MRAANDHTQTDHLRTSRRASPFAFRFRRAAPSTENFYNPSPFTETPVELKRGWGWLGRALRTMLNTLFMTALILALLALVIVFAYQMVYNPERLAALAYNLIHDVRGFFGPLIGF